MNKLLLSPVYEQNGNTAYSFYREGIGFGQIESVPAGENGGNAALITFSDALSSEDSALLSVHLNDISVYEDKLFDPKPVADLEASENALRFISLGINSVVSDRRKQITDTLKADYGDRLSKPRIKRAFERKLSGILLSDPQYEYSPPTQY